MDIFALIVLTCVARLVLRAWSAAVARLISALMLDVTTVLMRLERAVSAAVALETSVAIVLVSVPRRFGLSPSDAASSRRVSRTAGALSTRAATFWST